MDKREKFKNWMMNYCNISNSTIDKYVRSIDIISKELSKYGATEIDIYLINDSASIDNIKHMYLSIDILREKNKKGNRMYTSSLGWYKKYLNELEKINIMVKEPFIKYPTNHIKRLNTNFKIKVRRKDINRNKKIVFRKSDIKNKNIELESSKEILKIISNSNVYEREIITIPASGTIDLIYKYRIHAHPISGNYPYKKSLYYAFREKYGWMKNIYNLIGTVEIYPKSINSIKMIENEEITFRVKKYIEERSKSFGFSNDGKYKFYILGNEIELPNKIRIARQNNHAYITISEAYSGEIDVKRSNKEVIIKKEEIADKIEIKPMDNFIKLENKYNFIEGQKITKLIEIKKRNSSIRKIKLDIARKQLGQAVCEICGESDEVVLDIHHEKVMVSEMEENHNTKLSDLKILCANCHRKIHGHKLKFAELREKMDIYK